MEDGQEVGALPPAMTAPPLAPGRRPARAWLQDGVRVLAFRPPRWERLEASPLTLAVLVAALYALAVALQRVMTDGEPTFLWAGFLGGWVGIAVTAWLCWIAVRSSAATRDGHHPSAATLAALLLAMGLVLSLLMSAVTLGLMAALGPLDDWPTAWSWGNWLLPLAWGGLAQLVLLWRVAGSTLARGAALVFTVVPLLLNGWLAPVVFWWTEPPADPDAYAGLPLTSEVVGAQTELLADALGHLQPPQPGRVNVYALTFAPYASEDVFMRESAVVARTMRERFGAEGRLVELVVNPATSTTLPWATPYNLRKAIHRMAAVMDREHDVLFLHLTSHGGADGKLASNTWPLETAPMTPQLLKRWLDEAGVRWRVISVSACYSGSWVDPLAGDGTLVMTAADADHTSYGCGRLSELTFFGRAMYEEELRKTWSFTEAHEAAREVIKVREQEAGKSDGYSNPQIRMGSGIQPLLARLAREREAASAR